MEKEGRGDGMLMEVDNMDCHYDMSTVAVESVTLGGGGGW